MKFFIGRSRTFWVVEPKTGSVRKLPLSGVGLAVTFFVLVAISSVSAILTFERYSGGMVSVSEAIKFKLLSKQDAEFLKKTKELESTVAALQRQSEESKRLNARVVNKLGDLEGIIGSVSDEKEFKNEKSKSYSKGLLKPASFIESDSKIITTVEQRRTLQKLEHIVRQLKRLPLSNPVPGSFVTSRFGYRNSPTGEGGTRFHHGVDIDLNHTSTIRSAGNGVIKSIGYNSGYGLVIDIQHTRNVTTRYAHLSATKVKVGQRVKSGDVIAIGGATGRATGKHLHYEVRVRGRSQNPEIFMSLSKKIQMVLGKGSTHRKG